MEFQPFLGWYMGKQKDTVAIFSHFEKPPFRLGRKHRPRNGATSFSPMHVIQGHRQFSSASIRVGSASDVFAWAVIPILVSPKQCYFFRPG